MNKIYVGNLSYQTTQDGLKETFEQFGQVVDIRLITDRETGRSKGFGFITFESPEIAKAALELNGTQLDGRTIRVNIAEQR